MLALIGGVLLLDVLDVFDIRFWAVVGPVLLIAFGIWFLSSVFFGSRSAEPEQATIPLAGTTRASLDIQPGDSHLHVDAGAEATNLLSGRFGGGLERRVKRDGDTLQVSITPAPPGFWPTMGWLTRGSNEWKLVLNTEIPLSLDIQAGAGEAHIDLSALCVCDLLVQARSGAVQVILPSRVRRTEAVIKSGVAAVSLRIPEGVAARVRATGGLMSALVDTHRFPRTDSGLYQSPNYETAESRVDLQIETGLGVVTVH
jgi:hypothetical protein